MDKLKIRLKKNSKKMCILFAALFVILCYVIGFLWSHRARKSFGISSNDVTNVGIMAMDRDFETSDKDEIQIIIDQLNTIKLTPTKYVDNLSRTPDAAVGFLCDGTPVYDIVLHGKIICYRGRQYETEEDIYLMLEKICKEGRKRARMKRKNSSMKNEDTQ